MSIGEIGDYDDVAGEIGGCAGGREQLRQQHSVGTARGQIARSVKTCPR